MRTRDGSAWHLAEAERLIGRARAEAAPRPRVLAALRLLIAWAAGEKAPQERKDDGTCDRCFRRVYRGAEFCRRCEPAASAVPPEQTPEARYEALVAAEAARVAEAMKLAPPSRTTRAGLGLPPARPRRVSQRPRRPQE